jgi:hypothetical protein
MSKYSLPSTLGGFEKILKRIKAAKAKRDEWVPHLRDCYEYALPQREVFTLYAQGQKKNTHIYDDTAVIALQKFASQLQTRIVPPWRQWSMLRPGSEIPEDQHEGIQEDLDSVTKVIFDHINHSNFSTQANECFLELGIGTGALICNEGEGDNLLDFQAVPVAEIMPEEGPSGTIDTVWREHEVIVSNIKQTWPGADLAQPMEKLLKDKPQDKVKLFSGSVYCPKTKQYHTLVLDKKNKHVIFLQSSDTSAWIVPRWTVVAGETFGRGPVMSVLPTIKTCNKVVELTLRNAALAISGTYTGVNDGVMNPFTARLAPGTIIPVGSNSNQNPSLKALDRSGDFNVSELILADMREDIKMALFSSLRQAEGPVKSATEIALDNQELLQHIGSSFGRLETEFVERTLKRVVDILSRNGKIPPIRVDGKQITLKHTSPLAKAQDMDDLLVYQQYVEAVSMLGPEVMIMGTKVEEIPEFVGKKLGLDSKLLRDTGEKQQMKEQVAAMMAQMQAGGAEQ